jgi:hypothetical protein
MAARMLRHHAIALLAVIMSFFSLTVADLPPGYVLGKIDGQVYMVRDNRQPALYTVDFADCTGSSSINITRFDAAYYRDNMTIVFHFNGASALKNETIMSKSSLVPLRHLTNKPSVFIGVYAYGEARLDLTFDPCNANIDRYAALHVGCDWH